MRASVILVASALALAAIAVPAAAQSKRYPPVADDPDRVAAHDAPLWDRATDPDRTPYCADLTTARRAAEQRTTDETTAAIAVLDRAIALRPDAPDAYVRRGLANLELQRWSRCADDLQAAEDRAARPHVCVDAPVALAVQRHAFGVCQARAGRLVVAEQTFAQLAAAAGNNAELWTRLGETRIAVGKLDEAVVALGEAVRTSDPSQQAFMHWLLAVAHDRARRPGDANAEAMLAAGTDRGYSAITYPPFPLIGAGETEYMLGLAYDSGDAPEHALLYFRRFLKVAPTSPWRRRAEEHVAQLEHVALPIALQSLRDHAPADLHAALVIVQRAMPTMRACLAKTPGVVVSVKVTRAGPRTPDNVRDHSRAVAPPPGASTQTQLDLDDATRPDIDAARDCIQALADKLALPTIKELDNWYQLGFDVVAP